jgi:ubiquinone/menaquinone biosynthesis C-methylase UbiE
VLVLTLSVAAHAVGQVTVAESERLAAVLELAPGMSIADVGAGEGDWAETFARQVGDSGHVYATEIDGEELEKIQLRVEEQELANVTVIQGRDDDTGLPDACCDAILLRMVYHHFVKPAPMRRSLRRALRSGGLLVVIDIVPQSHWRKLEGVPERGGHGIPATELIAELARDGFELVARHDEWNGDEDRYCLVFRH